MGLHREIKKHLKRLGISHGKLPAKTPALDLLGGIDWPRDLDFEISVQRYRDLADGDLDDLDDEEIVDEMRFGGRGNLRFSDFWEDWEDDFPGVDEDPSRFEPFGMDEDYYFFLGENPDDPTDPMIFQVDHEDTHEPPSETPLSLGNLLAILERGEAIEPPGPAPSTVPVARAPVVSQTPSEIALEPLDGRYPTVIKVDSRGLALGSGGGYEGDRPYLDLGLAGLAPLQAELYPDHQGYWILQDHGGNDQTVFLGHCMQLSKQFPVHDNEVALGEARFRWVHLE